MFTGFSKDAVDFLTEIRLNNNQTFFQANKQRYERVVKAPLIALCEEMTPIIEQIDPRLDTRLLRTVSRIRRDTRFTRDKSPFRDHVWLSWRYPNESRGEAFGLYWGFGPDWISWGCGSYGTDKPLMDALRLHIRRQPDEVRCIFKNLQSDFQMGGEDYKRIIVPDDVPEDLRPLYIKKGFYVEQIPSGADWELLLSSEMSQRLAQDLLKLAPLQQLMRRLQAQTESADEAPVEQPVQSTLTVRRADEFDF